MFYIGLFSENQEKILSETIWPRVLIFGIINRLIYSEKHEKKNLLV